MSRADEIKRQIKLSLNDTRIQRSRIADAERFGYKKDSDDFWDVKYSDEKIERLEAELKQLEAEKGTEEVAQGEIESGKTIEERIEEVENRGEDTNWEENYHESMDLYQERRDQQDGITNPAEKEK